MTNNKKKHKSKKIKDEKKEALFSELNSLLSSGLDFSRAFKLLIDSESDKDTASLLKSVYNNVVKGELLWQAVKINSGFTSLDYGVIRIGEETGRLSESLDFLSIYYKKKAEQKKMVMSSLRYPIIILAMALLVVGFMLAVVVPMFEEVYSRMGGELPHITQKIISISKSFPLYGTIAFFVLLTMIIVIQIFREEDFMRKMLSAITMKLPVVGDIVKTNNQAHFCKLLYLLTSSGVPLLNSVNMLKSIITFYPYQKSFTSISSGLTQGELLSVNLERHNNLYNNKLIVLIRVGEETNKLADMLKKQGDELTDKLEYRLQKLGSLIEPVMVVFVGVLVAVILISMYMPMFKLGGIVN